jgi:hypothetical protein
MKAIVACLLALPLALTAACGGDDNGSGSKDAPVTHLDGGGDAPPDASCFTNPTTNDEIINACTTADKIYKDSHPPLLNDDGSLPPLP